MINFCMFEDDGSQSLKPLTETRPVYSCFLGMMTLFDRFYRAFGHGTVTLHCREYLKLVMKDEFKGFNINNINSGAPCLFFNGRAVLSSDIKQQIDQIEDHHNTLITYNGIAVALYLKGDLLNTMIQLLAEPPSNEVLIKTFRKKCVTIELEDCDILIYPWDFIRLNLKYIFEDFKCHNERGVIKGHISPFTVIYNENDVFIDKDAYLEDFVLIDATHGPVYIEEGVVVHAHTRLEGPLFIGKNTVVLGGRVSQSSLAYNCKISGEVTHSVFMQYSNKAHDGFIGHSYVGSWVNLGAFTTTSNLKNNYSMISVQKGGITQETHCQFLGSIIGDYVKTSVGTCLNSGSVIHLGSVLFAHDFLIREYLPFSWGKTKNVFSLDKFILSAERMMKRRHKKLDSVHIDLFSFLHKKYTA